MVDITYQDVIRVADENNEADIDDWIERNGLSDEVLKKVTHDFYYMCYRQIAGGDDVEQAMKCCILAAFTIGVDVGREFIPKTEL
jgi:hypothetical protein